MEAPKDLKQLRSFLGMVTCYRDMWPARSRVLTPLTNLLGNNGKCNKFEWGPEQDKAFKEMKALIAKDTSLACPDHNKVFKIETDACDHQLGGRLFQMHAPEDEMVIRWKARRK